MRLPFALVELPGAPGLGGSARWGAIDASLHRAKGVGASLVVFPECALTGYAPWGPDPRLDVGAAREALAERARATGLHVVLGWDAGDRCTLALAMPDGTVHIYDKQHPTPTEAGRWRRGRSAGIVPTAFGRVGLLVCADVLHPRVWEPLRGEVDLVVVAAAWPDYVGRLARIPAPLRPLARPVTEGSGPWRDTLLARAAASLGVPVVVCDATGPLRGAGPLPSHDSEGFRAASAAWDGRGVPVPLTTVPGAAGGRKGPLQRHETPEAGGMGPNVLVGEIVPGCTRSEAQLPRFDAGWRAFARGYDVVARARRRVGR